MGFLLEPCVCMLLAIDLLQIGHPQARLLSSWLTMSHVPWRVYHRQEDQVEES